MKPLLCFICALPLLCQQTTPIYQVTVIERTVKAINYKYRSDPTMIDFHGTVLLPKSKGEALVQSKQGRTEIDARFQNLTEPQRFGLEYLTYVLWALTPDGRPHNIGEIVPGTSDKAKLHVTTDMQAFALIVTAEPYSAVRQPSNVVVLENAVRPDTEGKIEEVEAKVELLPRGLYSWHVPDNFDSSRVNAPKVSMREYEAISELYQAQNAMGVARAAGADRYAANTFVKAQQLLTEAQQLQASKQDSARVVETAREAAQTAEDARVIAVKHQQDEAIQRAQADAAQARKTAVEAEQAVISARADVAAAQAAADAERAARQRAEERAAEAEARPVPQALQAPPPPSPPPPVSDSSAKTVLRSRLLQRLNGSAPTLDSPRGLVTTVSGFNGTQLAAVASVLTAYPGLRIEVEGHTDAPDSVALSQQRADGVRESLIRRGVPASMITARGLGNSHPLASNRTAAGREENQRIEIVISGDAIGSVPIWDRPYPLTSQ